MRSRDIALNIGEPNVHGIDQIWQQSDVLTGEKALARNTIRTSEARLAWRAKTSIRMEATKKGREGREETLKIFVILFSVRSPFAVQFVLLLSRSLENTPTS